ncbi:amidase [Mucilaginibacter sp. PPCGB 2223]|uniref:amidase n=1 Tax=Mucilaginibacter sp. PPCGB 2223 TaxID=1886027 RepID=UPI00082638C7|nr:amidase [Mucilaginibacter sp. PPCGB 2223]OCX54658.1 amidase [Mucilaginibacter sp. PPCGB 2223]
MLRKDFIKAGSLAGLALTSVLAASCNTAPAPAEQQKDSNDNDTTDNFELNEITIAALQDKMKSGEYTARSIAERYLKRIEAIDKKGPKLNAVIELNPDALHIADKLDKERQAGKLRGPMHGIPVLIKDNINTGDKMMTTAGALALKGNHAPDDAFIIKQLRAAGAVILGKTNLSEWANFRSSRSTSGWSSRGGQTRMPYILDRNPSGSSSGTGAGIAANLCAVGIGTETDGSIVSPSSVSGLVGIKPTVGLLSRSGIIPISKTQDTAGPMARTVADAATLLSVLTGVDANDPATADSKPEKDYTVFLDSKGLKGKRLGFEKSFLKGANEDVVALLNKTIDVLKAQGATIVEIDLLGKLKDMGKAEFTVLVYEFKDGLNKYLAGSTNQIKNIKDVVEFNKNNKDRTMPYFKQETLELALTKGDLNSKEYLDALKISRDGTRKAIDTVMKESNLDAICGTTNGLACTIDLANGDYDTGFSFSSPAAMAGYPHITVPMGAVHHLPIGFSFFGKAYSEGELIKLAYAFEQATNCRQKPEFVKNLLG